MVMSKSMSMSMALASSLFPTLVVLFLASTSHPTAARHHFRFPNATFSAVETSPPPPPTNYFEVTKPIIDNPKTKPSCSKLILRHDFASTYGKPPVFAEYSPPLNCHFSTVVLEWNATSKGRQFDRIFGVWLGGVELLRSCTAEPRPNGIFWKVEKDITRYYTLLITNQTLAVYMGNIVDTTYTGIYHVEIAMHFYHSQNQHFHHQHQRRGGARRLGSNSASGQGPCAADLVMPISRNNLPALNDGLWFEIKNSTDVETKDFKIPPNVYRAVLEVYVSFHENDEFWYSNYPNDYIIANNLSYSEANGPFREVVVTLDNASSVVGAVWPFTVIYTGGVNPLLWRPITGIGSYNLPSYDIELTPHLGRLLDGSTHRIEFSVTNALNVWYVDANLHLWLDSDSPRTEGKLLNVNAVPLQLDVDLDFQGLNGNFVTNARRSISSTGVVKSSHGEIVTSFIQELKYVNNMSIADDGNMQKVNQAIDFNTSVSHKKPSSSSSPQTRAADARIVRSDKRFSLYLYQDQLSQGNDSYIYVTNVSLGFDEHRFAGTAPHYSTMLLRNSQNAEGNMILQGNLVTSGVGSTQQVYDFDKACKTCYFRNISSSNYTILSDDVSCKCTSKPTSALRSVFNGQKDSNVVQRHALIYSL